MTEPVPTRSVGRRQQWMALSAILVAVACVYVPALRGAFVWDDVLLVRDNPAIRHPTDLATIFGSALWQFTSTPSDDYYRPLVTWTFAIDDAIGGGEPFAFHATNLALHLLAVVGLFLAVRRWFGATWLALGSAALFGLHPLATESVAWISGRGELITAVCMLGGIAAHAGVDRGAPWRTSACLLCGMLGKESAILLVPCCVAIDAFRGRTGITRRLAPSLLAIGAYAALRLGALGVPHATAPAFLVNPLVDADAMTRVASLPTLIWTALRLFVWPLELAPDYSFDAAPIASAGSWSAIGLGTLVAVLGAVVMLRSRRSSPALSAGLGFALVTSLLYLVNALVPFTNLFAERYAYLPSAGLAVAVAAAIAHHVPRRLATVAVVGLAIACGVRTAWRAEDWVDGVRLFERAVAVRPASAVAQQNLAEQLALRGNGSDASRAREHFERALAIYPAFAAPRIGLANLDLDAGRPRDALGWLEAAAVQDPTNAQLLLSRGHALAALDDLDAAARAFEAGREGAPWDSRFTTNLASIRYRQGDARGAERLWEAAIAMDPRDFLAHFNLAGLYGIEGRSDAMREAYRRFLASVPHTGYDDLEAHARDALRER